MGYTLERKGERRIGGVKGGTREEGGGGGRVIDGRADAK